MYSTGVILKNQYRKRAEKEMQKKGLRFWGYHRLRVVLIDKDGNKIDHTDWKEIWETYKEK